MALLDEVKAAMRLTLAGADEETTNAVNAELERLISAAKIDMGFAGVDVPRELDPILKQAIITYCRMNHGSPADYDRLKASYAEQKAQLSMASGYTLWGDVK